MTGVAPGKTAKLPENGFRQLPDQFLII